MTVKTHHKSHRQIGLRRRDVLALGTAAAVSPFFINHAWSKDVTYAGEVFDAKGATLRLAEWGGPWGALVHKYLLDEFKKDFNCQIEYDSTWPWFPKFVAGGPKNPPMDMTNWNLPEMFKTAQTGDYFLTIDEMLANIPNGKNLWPFATANGVGITWAYNRYGYAYSTKNVKTPPEHFKDIWEKVYAGKRGTYITSNTLQMVFFLVACTVFGKDQYDLNAGYKAMREFMPAKISDFTGNMQALLERGEVVITVLDESEPLRAKDKGAPFDFFYWKTKKPILTQTYTISKYAHPMQKKLAYALLNRTLEPKFLETMGKQFWLRPTIKNAILPDNLVRVGIKNDANAVKGYWIPDWNAYLKHEQDIVNTVNGIFAG